MVFEQELQRGVKKKTIASPRVIDFPKSSCYEDIIRKGKSVFFGDETDDIGCYHLCGPSGVPFDIKCPDDWVLQDFLKEHGFQPSKLRLYVMHVPEVSIARSMDNL